MVSLLPDEMDVKLELHYTLETFVDLFSDGFVV